jgi:hypothetical protein
MLIRKIGLVLAGAITAISVLGGTSAASTPSKPAPNGSGTNAAVSYLIHNVVTGKCADLPFFGAGTVDGPVNQYTCDGSANDNQLWYFNQVVIQHQLAPIVYQIQNVKDGLCLDVPFFGAVNAGTKVSEYHCGGLEDNQLYRLVPRQSGYWIVNYASGLCLDVEGFATGGNDARLTLYYCSDNDDHIWQLQ